MSCKGMLSRESLYLKRVLKDTEVKTKGKSDRYLLQRVMSMPPLARVAFFGRRQDAMKNVEKPVNGCAQK